jgi:hypothetical protein
VFRQTSLLPEPVEIDWALRFTDFGGPLARMFEKAGYGFVDVGAPTVPLSRWLTAFMKASENMAVLCTPDRNNRPGIHMHVGRPTAGASALEPHAMTTQVSDDNLSGLGAPQPLPPAIAPPTNGEPDPLIHFSEFGTAIVMLFRPPCGRLEEIGEPSIPLSAWFAAMKASDDRLWRVMDRAISGAQRPRRVRSRPVGVRPTKSVDPTQLRLPC